jgi:hypothetical protein
MVLYVFHVYAGNTQIAPPVKAHFDDITEVLNYASEVAAAILDSEIPCSRLAITDEKGALVKDLPIDRNRSVERGLRSEQVGLEPVRS